MIYKHFSINELLEYPDNAVFALECEELKLAYVTEAADLLYAIPRILKELRDNKKIKDLLPKFRIKILDIETHNVNRKYRAGVFMDEYKKNGYTVLNKNKPMRIRNIKIATKDGLYYVFFSTGRNTKHVVGVFDNAINAKSFYKNYYKKDFRRIVYCSNKLTEEYLGKKYPKNQSVLVTLDGEEA